jgi:hypothetical protein
MYAFVMMETVATGTFAFGRMGRNGTVVAEAAIRQDQQQPRLSCEWCPLPPLPAHPGKPAKHGNRNFRLSDDADYLGSDRAGRPAGRSGSRISRRTLRIVRRLATTERAVPETSATLTGRSARRSGW